MHLLEASQGVDYLGVREDGTFRCRSAQEMANSLRKPADKLPGHIHRSETRWARSAQEAREASNGYRALVVAWEVLEQIQQAAERRPSQVAGEARRACQELVRVAIERSDQRGAWREAGLQAIRLCKLTEVLQ